MIKGLILAMGTVECFSGTEIEVAGFSSDQGPPAHRNLKLSGRDPAGNGAPELSIYTL